MPLKFGLIIPRMIHSMIKDNVHFKLIISKIFPQW